MALLPKTINQVTGEASWRWRRIMAFLIVGFCFYVVYRLIDSADTQVNQAIVGSAFWLLFAVYLLYGGFATAQDITAIIATKSGRPYADPSAIPAPDTVSRAVTDDPTKPVGPVG